MNRTNWVQSLASLASAVAAVVLVVYVVLQLDFAKAQFIDYTRARKVEKMDALHDSFNSMRMLAARSEACRSHPHGSEPLLVVFNFFEKLAQAHEAGVVSTSDIDYYFRPYALFYWSAFRDWVRKNRVEEGEDPESGSLWSGYQRIVKELTQQGGAQILSKPQIERYLKAERDRFKIEGDMQRMAAASSR